MPRTKVFHHDRACGPCFLCHQSKQQYYAHPATWKESLLKQLLQINNEIDKESCICRSCEWDFKNGVGNAGYIPRWRAKTLATVNLGFKLLGAVMQQQCHVARH